MKFQVAFNELTKVATVQAFGDVLPVGSTNIGNYEHDVEADPLGPDVNHVTYHHVRDLLYFEGELDMQIVSIVSDTVYIALVSMVIAPATVDMSMAGAATQQLTITPTPADASNTAIASWVSSDPTKATVSATGLVTRVAIGTSTVTATSVDGARVATRLITVAA